MTTTKKGGHLIVDLKGVYLDTGDDGQANFDLFDMLTKARGKTLSIINFGSGDANIGFEDVLFITHVKYSNDEIDLALNTNSDRYFLKVENDNSLHFDTI